MGFNFLDLVLGRFIFFVDYEFIREELLVGDAL